MDALTPSPPRLLRVTEAAQLLGVSVSFLNKLRCHGGGPAFCKVGRAVAYDPSDLAAWLKSRRRVSTSDEG